MKRGLLLVIGILCAGSAAALDLTIQVGALETHPDILHGFFPTMAEIGVSYTGLSLIPCNTTVIGGLVGGGYMGREIWKASDGTERKPGEDPDLLNVWTARWEVLFSQGFLFLERTSKNLVTSYTGITGRWEHFSDVEGTVYDDDDFSQLYPDVGGIVSNALIAGVEFDWVKMEGIIPRGASGELRFAHAPSFVNWDAEYSLLTGIIKGYVPLYILKDDVGQNLFSVYLANRLQIDQFFRFEKDVPMFALDEPALGTKMRGLERLSRAGALTVVNNFDIRFSGPELYLDSLYPRLHVFADVGYTDGGNANTPESGEGEMFASAGVEGGISFFDFLNLGYRASWMIQGENLVKKPFVHGVYVSLIFK